MNRTTLRLLSEGLLVHALDQTPQTWYDHGNSYIGGMMSTERDAKAGHDLADAQQAAREFRALKREKKRKGFVVWCRILVRYTTRGEDGPGRYHFHGDVARYRDSWYVRIEDAKSPQHAVELARARAAQLLTDRGIAILREDSQFREEFNVCQPPPQHRPPPANPWRGGRRSWS